MFCTHVYVTTTPPHSHVVFPCTCNKPFLVLQCIYSDESLTHHLCLPRRSHGAGSQHSGQGKNRRRELNQLVMNYCGFWDCVWPREPQSSVSEGGTHVVIRREILIPSRQTLVYSKVNWKCTRKYFVDNMCRNDNEQTCRCVHVHVLIRNINVQNVGENVTHCAWYFAQCRNAHYVELFFTRTIVQCMCMRNDMHVFARMT
jgi:hypothetical protein